MEIGNKCIINKIMNYNNNYGGKNLLSSKFNSNKILNCKSTPNIFNNNSDNLILEEKNKSNLINLRGTYLSNSLQYTKINNNNKYYLKKNLNNTNNHIIKGKDLNLYKNINFSQNVNYFPKYLNNKEYERNEKKHKNVNIFINDSAPLYNINKNDSINNIESISDDENTNLSDIADIIVNSFPKNKKLNKVSVSPSFSNNKNNHNTNIILQKKTNKINLSQKNSQRINPQNYTFKTVFVNNFCVLPMNSSFTNNKNKYKDPNNKPPKLYNDINLNMVNNKSNKSCKNHPSAFTDNNIFKIKNNDSKAKLKKERENSKTMANINIKNKSNINLNLITKNKKNNSLKNMTYRKKNIPSFKTSNVKVSDLKENNFNEEYYYNTMDLSKLNIIKEQEAKKIQIIKKHIQFDLNRNVYFFYNDQDYISKYKKIPNNNINSKKLKINLPIIRHFNIGDIKVDNTYKFKENLDEKDIISESVKCIKENNL